MQITVSAANDEVQINMSVDEAARLKLWIEQEAPAVREGWLTAPKDPGVFPIEELYGLLDAEVS